MKKTQKFLALVLVLALCLGLTLPAAATDKYDDLTAKLFKAFQEEKSPADGDTYVYPYSTTFGATAVKGGSTLLQFKLAQDPPSSSDIFCAAIYRGTPDEVLEAEEPNLVEVRTYDMSKFGGSARALGMTWTANANYPVGDYTLICFIMSSEGEVYYQAQYIIDLYVVSGATPATGMELLTVEEGIFDATLPTQLGVYSTVCIAPSLLPYANTSDRTVKVSTNRPDLVDLRLDANYVYLTGKGVGTATVTISCGSFSQNLVLNVGSLTYLNTSTATPELCIGMTAKVNASYDPASVPVALEWKSSNPAVATVKDGIVTAVGEGTASISAFAGGKSSTVQITVRQHQLPEGTPVSERTATQPAQAVGHCSLCGQDDAAIIYEPAIFTDTVPTAWYAEHIDYIYDNQLMNGTSASAFSPNNPVSRAQLVTVLYRMMDEPEVSGELPFSDVDAGLWYSNAIDWAAENEIVTGYPDGTFRPNQPVSREQLATILYRYIKSTDAEMAEGADLSSYPDAASISGYAKEAVSWAVAEGLISGVATGGQTLLLPQNSATRAQFATILSRYLQAE